jgi:hypothetical protein
MLHPLREMGVARCRWFTPVILATWEAEIRRIIVSSQVPRQIERPYLKNTHEKKGWWSGSSGSMRPSLNPSTTKNKKTKERERKNRKRETETDHREKLGTGGSHL